MDAASALNIEGSAIEVDPLFHAVTNLCRARIPGFEVRLSPCSRWLRFLNIFVRVFNREWLSRYIVTMGPRVYFPSLASILDPDSWRTLAHEYVHLHDRHAAVARFTFTYLAPQAYAVAALLSFLSLGALGGSRAWLLNLLWLLALGALAPWRSPARTRWEVRGYTMNLAVRYWTDGEVPQEMVDWIVGQFTGWAYFRMEPDEQRIRVLLAEQIARINSGVILEEPVYREVYAVLKSEGRLHGT